MRRARLKAPEHVERAIYHCVSRVVNRDYVLGEAERERFVSLMRLYERLCGVQVITFCVLSNHFHILVEVPRRPEVLPTDEALIALIRETQGDAAADRVAGWFDQWGTQGNRAAIEQERERWFGQMWDVSRFMKALKQRFTQWFNGHQPIRRKGTLWEERFRSVLVESGAALQAVAAYIDLNPIRAGVVEDPKDYRWCGYGEACAGQAQAKAGLLRASGAVDPGRSADTPGSVPASFEVLSWYRERLFGGGMETRDGDGRLIRLGFSRPEIEAVRDVRGRLPQHVYLRLRVRYFTDGAILGSKAFVESIFHSRRDLFSAKRLTASRRLKGLDFQSPLRTARALVRRPTG
jgi:putative transposase